jgi:hypothetical protein
VNQKNMTIKGHLLGALAFHGYEEASSRAILVGRIYEQIWASDYTELDLSILDQPKTHSVLSAS